MIKQLTKCHECSSAKWAGDDCSYCNPPLKDFRIGADVLPYCLECGREHMPVELTWNEVRKGVAEPTRREVGRPKKKSTG